MNQAQKDPRLSLGYMWDEALQDYKYKPMRTVDNIGPAGAINSNVLDMAQWLRLQLGRDEYQGQRLISEENLRETWTSHIDIAGGVSYGLGWMLREWEGQPVIEHGGNVKGFAAQVAMLPESDLGFVLLTNVYVTPLQQLSINMVWDALLEDWEDADTADKTEDYESYLGSYLNKFGPLKDREYTVLIENSRLALDAAGEAVYELKEPDEEGKWYFVISDQAAISFDRDDEGNVIAIEIHQGGLTFEIPRIGVEIAPEIDLNELQRYLGSYYSDNLSITAEVLIQNNRLAIDVPGEMVYEMYPPDEQGIWVVRVSNRLTLKFNETQDGQIDSLTYYPAGQAYEMNRVEGRTLPTVEEILALRQTDSRNEALQEMGTYKISGTFHSLQSGVKGNVTIYVGGNERYRVDFNYGKYGYSREAVNGDRAWSESSFASFEEYYGKFLEQEKRGHPAAYFGDWRDFNNSISLLGTRVLDGNEVYVLKLEHDDLPPITIYIDTTTGDVLRTVIIALSEGEIAIPMVVHYEDYREVNGVRIPFRTISSNEQSGRSIVQYESIEVNLDIDEGFFILSAPD